ncbi:MAG: hypothetical protein IJS82_06865 [Paludibacteraceae bacterium]|nr:hypothetical protein [Paludibacteraceae bacterium]
MRNSSNVTVDGPTKEGGYDNNVLIDFYRTNTSWAVSGTNYIAGIYITYELTYNANIFGFAATAVRNNSEYGTVSATVAKDTIQGTPGQSSASTTATYTATVANAAQYKFLGWYSDEDYTVQASTDNPYTPSLTNETAGSRLTRTLYAKFGEKGKPTITCNIASSYEIEHAEIDLQTLWTREGTGVVEYSIKSFTPSGENNDGATEPALRAGRYVSLGQAGTLKLQISVAAAGDYSATIDSAIVIINKKTPVFTWDGDEEENDTFEYYFNSVTNDIFSSTGEADTTYIVNDNEYSAFLMGDSLMVFNVREDAHITISQPETYKWNAHEKTYTIRPKKESNHVPFTITSSNMDTYEVELTGEAKRESGKDYTCGDGTWAGTRPEGCIIIHFEGIPDTISFRISSTAYLGQYPAEGDYTFQVYESPTNGDWGEATWTIDNSKGFSSLSDSEKNISVSLSPNTRYVKLRYKGSCWAHFSNIHVGEKEQFESDPVDLLDFGLQGQNYGEQIKTFNFNHANAGRVTNVRIVGADACKYDVTPAEIPATGRDIASSMTLRVSFDNMKPGTDSTRNADVPYLAKIEITDNAGHRDTINLSGRRHGKSYPQFTFNPNHVPYYFGTTIHTPVVSTNTDAPITIYSETPTVADIVDGKLEIYSVESEATIRVSQPECGDFRAYEETFKFTPRAMPPLSVPFMMTSTIAEDDDMVTYGADCSWNTDNIRSGYSDAAAGASGRYWDSRKEFVIIFGGTPDKLSFKAKNTYCSIKCRWKVEQSFDGSNWSEVFYKSQSCKDWVTFSDIQLDPGAQFLRFQYGGNYTGYFKDINVTALDGTKYMLTPEGKYLSRGGEYGTQAVVGEFGVPVRVTRYTSDNTNIYTRVQYMDSRDYLFSLAAETDDKIFTDAGSRNGKDWIQTVSDGKVKVQNALNSKYVTVDANNKVKLTSTEGDAVAWEIEDYTIHQSRIDAKIDREAAAAALPEFGSDINTMAKVYAKLRAEQFDSTNVYLPPKAALEVKGEYRTASGTNAIFDTIIHDLDTGFYCLTVQALYRPAKSPRDWENHVNGMESHPAYIYANDFKHPIKSVFDATGRIGHVTGDTLCPDGYYPADLASATTAFSNAGAYLHYLYVYVHADEGETTGTLNFGIKNPSYVAGSWLAYKNFTLTKIARREFIFVGDSGDEWNELTNWEYQGSTPGDTPNEHHAVTIDHDVKITGQVKAYRVKINDGVHVTIESTGGLTVGEGGVRGASADKLKLKASTSGATIGQTGYLRISPNSVQPMPNASVELFSIGYYDKSQTGDDAAAWQCVGSPLADTDKAAKSVYTQSWIYSWVESEDDWVNDRKNLKFKPFTGYITTQYKNAGGTLLTYEGQLVSGQRDTTIQLAYSGDGKGHNFLANSYSAPIDISKFKAGDFHHATPTIYIRNAGTKDDSDNQMEGNSRERAAAPGQYLAIPISSAADLASSFDYPVTIPSMQGFWVDATAADATITLKYDSLVWSANYVSHPNKPMRVRKQDSTEESSLTGTMQITLESDGWYDNLFMLESERYEAEYEPGSDALKKESGRFNVFTVVDQDKLSVDATNSLIGTQIGVRTGEETAYTLTFSHVESEDELALLDVETEETIVISEGMQYTFFAAPNSEITDRFVIVERNDAPQVATGVEPTSDSSLKGRGTKFIKDNQLYILKNGVLYDSMGKRVE